MVRMKIMAVIAALSIPLSGCGGQVKKYDWLASESAHPDFPMKIVSGEFRYPSESSGLPIPNMKLIHYGWGKSVSVHIVGPDLKPLPDRMTITYYSYLEDVFYQGVFDLPVDEIAGYFEGGYQLYSGKGATFNEIVAGVAPGGQVAVWLQGIERSVEVFFGKAEPIDYRWESFIDNASITREEYQTSLLNELVPPEKLAEFEKEGIPFDKFERFRNHYPWAMRVFRMSPPSKSVRIEYLNGEKEVVRHLDADGGEPEPQLNPLPRFMAFRSGGALFYIHFDEDEMLEVFEEMSSDDDPLYLDVAPGLPQSETQIRLRDKDDNHTALTKFTVEEIN